MILEAQGYQVETRVSSLEALALFKAEPQRFDLVMTDLTMPQMTGDKLAGENGMLDAIQAFEKPHLLHKAQSSAQIIDFRPRPAKPE